MKHTDEIINNIRVFGISSLPIFIYKDFRFAHPFFIKKRMKKILEDFKPEIIHLQSHFTVDRAMFKVANKKNIPIVATNHFMPENLTHYLPFPKKIIHYINEYMWRDFAKVFNKISFITTPTEIAADLIRPRLSVPVTSVTCGIDLEKFNPKNDSKDIKNKYKIPNDKPVLLFVGRLDKEKRIDQVMKASAKAMKKVDFTFIVGGKGSEANNLKKLAEELKISDSVIFTDFISDDDLPNLYASANCFVNACPFELQCIVVMEAMATSLPIIAVNAGALPHLVEDGVNGALFEKDDIIMLSEKIIDFMSNKDKCNTMGKESLRLINTHGILSMITSYLEIYKKAIEQKNVLYKNKK